MAQSVSEFLQSFWNAPAFQTDIVVLGNILMALLLGLTVGYERSYRGRAAGMRTYGLVCMASSALTVMAGYPHFWYNGDSAGLASIDPTRTVQGIVTGIGFLGAGIIMKDGLNISGLTTAASIWATAAIGVLVGVGFYAAAVLLTLLSAGFMLWGGKVEAALPSRHAIAVMLHFRKGFQPNEESVQLKARECGYEIARGSIAIHCHNGQPEWRFVVISMGKARGASIFTLSEAFPAIDGVENFQLTHARN